jgi:hypothetical protein
MADSAAIELRGVSLPAQLSGGAVLDGIDLTGGYPGEEMLRRVGQLG